MYTKFTDQIIEHLNHLDICCVWNLIWLCVFYWRSVNMIDFKWQANY